MVPVSQALAKFGFEGPYMKEVDDAAVVKIIEKLGGKVLVVRKNNLAVMKKFTKQFAKGLMDESVLQSWFDFESRLNELVPSAQLSSVMGATIIVAQKT